MAWRSDVHREEGTISGLTVHGTHGSGQPLHEAWQVKSRIALLGECGRGAASATERAAKKEQNESIFKPPNSNSPTTKLALALTVSLSLTSCTPSNTNAHRGSRAPHGLGARAVPEGEVGPSLRSNVAFWRKGGLGTPPLVSARL